MAGQPKVKVGLSAFLTNEDGKVLVGVRKGSHGAGTLALPGGHLEYGETWDECAAREIMEETGLSVSDFEFVGATNDRFESRHYTTIFMKCRMSDYTQQPQLLEPDKCEGWQWMHIDELRDQPNLFLPLSNFFASGFI